MKTKVVLLMLLLCLGIGVIATQIPALPMLPKQSALAAPASELTTTAATGFKKAMQQLGVLFLNTNGTLTTGEGFGVQEMDDVTVCNKVEYEKVSTDEGVDEVEYKTKGAKHAPSEVCEPLEGEERKEVNRMQLCKHTTKSETVKEKLNDGRLGHVDITYEIQIDCDNHKERKRTEKNRVECLYKKEENFQVKLDDKTIRKYEFLILDCNDKMVDQKYKDSTIKDPCETYLDPNVSIEERASQINSYLRNSYSLVGGADDNSSATDIGSTPVIPIQQTFGDLEAHIPNTSMLTPYVNSRILTNEILGGLTPEPDSRRLIMSCKYYPIMVKGLSVKLIEKSTIPIYTPPIISNPEGGSTTPTEPPSPPENTATELPKTPGGMFEYMRMHMDKYFPHPDFHFEPYDQANSMLWQNAANFGAGTLLNVVDNGGNAIGLAIVSKSDNNMETGFVITLLKDGLKGVDAEKFVTKYQYGYKHTELSTEQSGVTEFFYKELSYGNQSESTIVNAILQYNQLKALGGNRLLGDNSGGESVGINVDALAADLGNDNADFDYEKVTEDEANLGKLAAIINGEIPMCEAENEKDDPCAKLKKLGKDSNFRKNMGDMKKLTKEKKESGIYYSNETDAQGNLYNYNVEKFEGKENEHQIKDIKVKFMIDVMIHTHFDGGSSIFSPDDISAFLTLYNKGCIKNISTFTFALVTSQNTQYLLQVDDVNKFQDFANKYKSQSNDAIFNSFNKMYKDYGIGKAENLKNDNESAFLNLLNAYHTGLSLVKGNKTFTKWKARELDNLNYLQNKECNQ